MPEPVAQPPPRITRTTALVATWVLMGVSTAFFITRIIVRLQTARRLYWDDAWATGALITLVGLCITLTLAIPGMYALLEVGSGKRKPGPTFMADASYYLKLQFALSIEYWTCLWLVKGCFLSFYHRLTAGLKYCRMAWWGIVVFTIISYAGCVVTYPVSCSSFKLGECETPLNVYRSKVSLQYSTAVDVISDIFIILLPLYLAFRVQLPWNQKVALGAVFSLGAIIMVFAGIRIAVNNETTEHVEVSWLNLWSQIEASVAVIISSVAPFKAFFTQRQMKSYGNGNSPGKPYPPTSWPGSSHLRGGSRPPASIPLEERSNHFAVHHHGTINMASRDGDSTEKILQEHEAKIAQVL